MERSMAFRRVHCFSTCILVFMNTVVPMVIIKLHSWLCSLIISDSVSMLFDSQHCRRRRGTGSCEERKTHFNMKFQRFSCFIGGSYFCALRSVASWTYQGGSLGTLEWCWWGGWAGTWTCPVQVLTLEWGNGFGSIHPVRKQKYLLYCFLWSHREWLKNSCTVPRGLWGSQ